MICRVMSPSSDLKPRRFRPGQIIQPKLEQLSTPKAALNRNPIHEPVAQARFGPEWISGGKLKRQNKVAVGCTARTDQPVNAGHFFDGQRLDPLRITALTSDCVKSLIETRSLAADLIK
jgi:hypothetical protein